MRFDNLYHHELAERERLRSGANITIGALAIVGGLLGSLIQGGWFDGRAASLTFASFCVVASIFFCRALWFLVRCYHGHTYKLLPTALSCRAHQIALREWHEKVGTLNQAEADFDEWLEEAYATAADVNAQVNWTRSGCLFKANGATIYALVFTLAAAVPYLVHAAQTPAPPLKIEVVDSRPQPLVLEQEKPMEDPKPTPPPPPPKPPEPPLRDLREGRIPSAPKPQGK